jgi:ArsR family transcriptional regulator
MPELTPLFGRTPIDHHDAAHLAGAFKALADPARLQLLSLLVSDEATCQELIVELGRLKQTTVSHHLRVLADAGFITRRRDTHFVYNALAPAGFAAVADALRPGGGR